MKSPVVIVTARSAMCRPRFRERINSRSYGATWRAQIETRYEHSADDPPEEDRGPYTVTGPPAKSRRNGSTLGRCS